MSVDGMMLDISALSEEDAMALLGYHTGKNYSDDDRAHELCKILGNHPYALEMAGKRLKVYGHLSPERLIRDIHNAPHNLVVTGKLGIEKQRSVKELLDESVDELSPDLHELLTQMGGLYASHASLNLLEKVTGKESDTLEYEIAELERNGLLQLHVGGDDVPAHYRLHDLTYSYVHTLSKKEKSHNNRVISGVQSFTREYVKDYDLLQFDLMNILGTARKAYHEKQHDNLISIMRQLVVDANYLTARGSPVAAMDLLKVTIEAARAMNDVEAAHYLLCKIGNVYLLVTNQYSHAVKAYSEAYEFSLQLQDLRRQAILLSLIRISRFKAGLA